MNDSSALSRACRNDEKPNFLNYVSRVDPVDFAKWVLRFLWCNFFSENGKATTGTKWPIWHTMVQQILNRRISGYQTFLTGKIYEPMPVKEPQVSQWCLQNKGLRSVLVSVELDTALCFSAWNRTPLCVSQRGVRHRSVLFSVESDTTLC